MSKLKQPTCIKIAATGAHGTGKTTFMDKLQEKIAENSKFDVYRSANITRNAILALPQFFNDVAPSSIIAQQYTILALQLSSYYSAPDRGFLLSDRGFLDMIVYTQIRLSQSPTTDKTELYLLNGLKKAFEEALNLPVPFWDYLIFFPIRSEMELDGTRPNSLSYQSSFQASLVKLLEKYSPDFALYNRLNSYKPHEDANSPTSAIVYNCNSIAHKLIVVYGQPNWNEEVEIVYDKLVEHALVPSIFS